MQPLVSVMIPYYNDEKYLSQGIDSVLNQTYSNIELILINHACTDNSRNIARSYTDTRIRHIDLEKNMGAGGSLIWAEFLSQAKGEYVKVFCADDILVPNAIEVLVRHMQENPNIDLLAGSMTYIDENNNPLIVGELSGYKAPILSKEEVLLSLTEAVTPFAYPTVIIKKEVAQKAKVNPVLVYLADVQFWTSIALQGYTLQNIEDEICLYRMHSEQTSSIGSAEQREIITKFEYPIFCESFFDIKDVEILKTICAKSPYLPMLDSVDARFYPFILCHRFVHNTGTSYISNNNFIKATAFKKLCEILSIAENRESIEKYFSYTIKELRALYRSEEFTDSFKSAPIYMKVKERSKLEKFMKNLNPFYHWKGYKEWKNKVRSALGIQKKDKTHG